MNDALRALDASVPRADMRIGAALHGSISYLRIARTTLAASGTSHRELYAWEFSGPALQTWTGETR